MNNSPAFPTTPENETRMSGVGGVGLTKREYFAAQAMVAILGGRKSSVLRYETRDVAAMSCDFADALLTHLEKTGKPHARS